MFYLPQVKAWSQFH